MSTWGPGERGQSAVCTFWRSVTDRRFWHVHIFADGFPSLNFGFRAVCDDFGNLVEVPR